jgi:hypothetical protein
MSMAIRTRRAIVSYIIAVGPGEGADRVRPDVPVVDDEAERTATRRRVHSIIEMNLSVHDVRT